MAVITIYMSGDPTAIVGVEEEDFICTPTCEQTDGLWWCEWCGQWECTDHRCCPECAGDLDDCGHLND